MAYIKQRNWPFWIVLVLLLAAWQFGTQDLGSSLIIVPPSAVVAKAIELWQSGELLRDIHYSGVEFLLGFIIGAVAGMVVGVISGNWRPLSRVISPFVSSSYATPIIALAPLFILALGIGLVSKVAVVALEVFFPMLLTTAAGVMATESSYRELARAFRLSPFASITKILIPSAIPHIVSGLRVSVGRGLTAVLAAELFGAEAGLGLLILNSSNTFDTAGVFVGIVIFAVSGVSLTRLFSLLERRVAPWRHA